MVFSDLLNPNKPAKPEQTFWSFQLKFPKNVEALVYIYRGVGVGLAPYLNSKEFTKFYKQFPT